MNECTMCGKKGINGSSGLCAKCYQRQYRIDHREQLLEYQSNYRKLNHDRVTGWSKRSRLKMLGMRMKTNKECSQFLGVYVAESVLSKVFEDVQRMPVTHPGYDFVCNRGKKIDVKSATRRSRGNNLSWGFNVNKNTTADYFLVIAFDDRHELTPLHLWMMPGHVVNDRVNITISHKTIDKWDEYRLDVDKVVSCCDEMKHGGIHERI